MPEAPYTGKTYAMKDHYADFSVDDFLQDPYFYEWVRYPTPEHNVFWQAWLIQHPGKQNTVEQARRLLTAIIKNENPLPPHFKAEDWHKIQQKIALSEPFKLKRTSANSPIRSIHPGQ